MIFLGGNITRDAIQACAVLGRLVVWFVAACRQLVSGGGARPKSFFACSFCHALVGCCSVVPHVCGPYCKV